MTKTVDFPLTTRTRVALSIARGLAAAMGHDDLTPAHIALGMLREGENPAVAAIHHGGVALHVIRRDLEACLEPRGRTRPREVALLLTPGEQRLLDQASSEGRIRNDEHVGTEHLLLAILRDASSPTAAAFARHGFRFETAVTHLEFVIHRHAGPFGPHTSSPAV